METIRKTTITLILIVILLLSVNYCSHNRQKIVEGEKKELENQLKKSTESIKKFRERQATLFDSLLKLESLKDKRITELKKSNDNLNQRIENSQKQLQQKKDSYKNKSFEELARLFKELGYEDVIATNNSVNLEKDTPVDILDNLAEGENCMEIIPMKDSIIYNKDEEIKIIKEKVSNRDFMLVSKQNEIEALNQIQKTLENINKKSEKEIKNLKLKNTLKWVYVGLAGFVGFKIGAQK